ncbi:energy-coupling factor transporter ATPase [Anaerorhabdus furcosa]|uniref:Energy-coupling factor transport system ATP-binding protein n=1 Tax=Anaerorhabdus furcosa TaxID=118967 RepID=A0A1T4L2T5_9FIRM|nr:energy-coupling factor transporter ATPase [Anaerorhabdus furcosa]SJZ49024.1 energy-coupling factor transport system ATP-binding protein [Anaerorhabdus furcosa]
MNHVIEVKNLSFSYDNENMAVDGVSFSIEKGSYTTIVGHNGSGKSTIAKLLMGLLEKKSGDIVIAGLELTQENLQKIRSQIGIVFQNPDNQFIGSTVRDDIAFGLENHCVEQDKMDNIINEFASKVKMTDYLNSEPTKLSGGQKQRVAIAGVLAMKPSILIFDEATSMLDPQGKDEIKKLIRELHQDETITIISITHDIEEVSKSDDVIVMDQGHIVMSGKPQEILVREKELVSIKLDIPFSLKMQKALKKQGVNIKETVTMEGLVEELCQYNLKK